MSLLTLGDSVPATPAFQSVGPLVPKLLGVDLTGSELQERSALGSATNATTAGRLFLVARETDYHDDFAAAAPPLAALLVVDGHNIGTGAFAAPGQLFRLALSFP